MTQEVTITSFKVSVIAAMIPAGTLFYSAGLTESTCSSIKNGCGEVRILCQGSLLLTNGSLQSKYIKGALTRSSRILNPFFFTLNSLFKTLELEVVVKGKKQTQGENWYFVVVT